MTADIRQSATTITAWEQSAVEAARLGIPQADAWREARRLAWRWRLYATLPDLAALRAMWERAYRQALSAKVDE